jgi:hypothetical protein
MGPFSACLVKAVNRLLCTFKSSPAVTMVLVLTPLMLLEGVGIGMEGRKRYGTFASGIMLMAATLVLVWNVMGGAVMYLGRHAVRDLVQRSRMREESKFVLLATTLAMLEEAVTTTLTNLGPLFGNRDAFITASRNYLEVVVWHSVVVIVPMFVVWAWLLSRYKFSPAAVLILFGINGVLAELLIGGPALLMAPFWIFVYGLMVFLPAFSFRSRAAATVPHWYHYPIAIVACLLASAALALVVNLLSPRLPHFGKTLVFPT